MRVDIVARMRAKSAAHDARCGAVYVREARAHDDARDYRPSAQRVRVVMREYARCALRCRAIQDGEDHRAQQRAERQRVARRYGTRARYARERAHVAMLMMLLPLPCHTYYALDMLHHAAIAMLPLFFAAMPY